ncbi:MAG: two-component regulator propeller domain-containing protein, partial [Acidobacteriota bacterium]
MATRSLTPGFLSLALLATAALALPSETEYSKRIWRSGDGLPQNKIQVISQTGDGYLWIGTSGGLVRFDGVRFVVFDRSTTPALGDDSILSLCPTRDGSLWIGTEGGGLVRMKGGAFQAFGTAQGLTNLFVRAIGAGREGQLWVATDRGIFRLDAPFAPTPGRLRRLDGPYGAGRGVPILAAQSIYQDRDGVPWIGSTNYGLYRLEGDQLLTQPSWQALGSVSAILEDPEGGGLLLASESGLRHLRNGQMEPLRASDPASPRALCRDHDGNLWIGTAGYGLVRVGSHGTSVFTEGAGGGTLPDNGVLSVFEDREQNIWIGTQDGLLRLTPGAVRTVTKRDGLADDDVATVYEDPGGRLWIGTVHGPL